MTNKTWTTGDALTGATLNKEISAATSAGGTFTPYTPLIGAYGRAIATFTSGATTAPVSLGASQSTGGYALQGDLVHFWAMYRWDATQSFNGAAGTVPRTFVMATPFPLRPLDWADYGTTTGTSHAKARWVPTSINLSARIAPQYGMQRGNTISPLYDSGNAGYIGHVADDWSDAQLASLVCFRLSVGADAYVQVNDRDIQFDSVSDAVGGNNPKAAAYNFTYADRAAWFFMSGWYIRTDDRLVEHPTHVN